MDLILGHEIKTEGYNRYRQKKQDEILLKELKSKSRK